MKRTREPDLRLLCEKCGYHLKGLRRADACPECGKLVVESLPEKRVGTPWQNHPGWRGWWRTERLIEKHPVGFWSKVAQGTSRDIGLIVINCVASGFSGFVVLELLDRIISWDWGTLNAAPLLFGATLTVVLLVLMGIEAIGMWVISWRHGWRLSGRIRLSVIAHASYGWVLIPIVLGAHAVLVIGLEDIPLPAPDFVILAVIITLALTFLIPLLAFETLVYFGMRNLRYINAPGSERELVEDDWVTPHPPPAAGPSPSRRIMQRPAV